MKKLTLYEKKIINIKPFLLSLNIKPSMISSENRENAYKLEIKMRF